MKRETVTSARNPLLVHLKKLLASRSYREACGEFAADGTKLLEEAAKWYPGLETVVVQTGVELCPLPEHVRVVEIPESLMRSVSQMEAPQGAIFICRLPEARPAALRPGTLLLDGIQDPGNLGTILRTADALDVPVILTEGCCDPYNAKTVRATMGAIFRTAPGCLTRQQLIDQCREKRIPLLATALSDRAKDIRQQDLRQAAVVIGSEGQGVSQQLLEASLGQLMIPMHPRCESLNASVAAAIVLWQMTGL